MSNCCTKPEPEKVESSCCGTQKEEQAVSCCGTSDHDHAGKFDWLMWGSAVLIAIPYALFYLSPPMLMTTPWLHTYVHSVHEFVNASWWGVLVGIGFLAVLSHIPREFIMTVLGNKRGAGGIVRAMLAGVLLDLCSHGILMVGTKIYQRGASAGQLMAFLVASPWNSISLTFILIALIGLKLTALFLFLSVVIAFTTGIIFDFLVDRKILPENPNKFDMPDNFRFFTEAKKQLSAVEWKPSLFASMLWDGAKDSGMVVRWLLFGIVVASLMRVFIDPAAFAQYFGPTILGLSSTVVFAAIMEVCSHGSSPIAADLVTRGHAVGNAFAFLMAGVATDYTEIIVLKQTTKSWKIALFLPLITLPQIILLAVILNIGL